MGKLSFSWKMYPLPILLVGLLMSCLTPIDFPAANKGGRLIISGQISTLPGRSVVEIGETSLYNQKPVPISRAVVIANDDLGNEFLFTESIASSGRYVLQGSQGKAGRSYTIRVSLADGLQAESIPEKMQEDPGKLTTSYTITTEDYVDGDGTFSRQPFVNVLVNTDLPSVGTNYIRWKTEETYLLSPTDFPDILGNIPPPCFVDRNADPQRISLLDGSASSARQIQKLIGTRVIDYSFLEKHAFTIYQIAISYEAYEYWRKVDLLANQVGSIFDTPPGELVGNVFQVSTGQKFLGYFQAVNETYDRFFIYPFDLPFSAYHDNVQFYR